MPMCRRHVSPGAFRLGQSGSEDARMNATVAHELISDIYATVVHPQGWRGVLQRIAGHVGAVGSVVMRVDDGVQWLASPDLQRHVEAYIDEGWMADTARTAPLFAERHPGFRIETDYRSMEELEALPVYRGFLHPRGWRTGSATVLQGARDDLLQIAVEGYTSIEQAAASMPFLDQLRPHLARALTLASDLEQGRVRDIVETLSIAGYDAAIVSTDGRPLAVNAGFERIAESTYRVTAERLQFRDADLDRQLVRVLKMFASVPGVGASVIAAHLAGGEPFVIHMIPLPGTRIGLVDRQAVALIAASGANRRFPQSDALRLLFDLTPAEERLCRILAEGHSIAEAARLLGTRPATCRVHLRSIFSKTGVSRQSSLIRMLFKSRLVA